MLHGLKNAVCVILLWEKFLGEDSFANQKWAITSKRMGFGKWKYILEEKLSQLVKEGNSWGKTSNE